MPLDLRLTHVVQRVRLTAIGGHRERLIIRREAANVVVQRVRMEHIDVRVGGQ